MSAKFIRKNKNLKTVKNQKIRPFEVFWFLKNQKTQNHKKPSFPPPVLYHIVLPGTINSLSCSRDATANPGFANHLIFNSVVFVSLLHYSLSSTATCRNCIGSVCLCLSCPYLQLSNTHIYKF